LVFPHYDALGIAKPPLIQAGYLQYSPNQRAQPPGIIQADPAIEILLVILFDSQTLTRVEPSHAPLNPRDKFVLGRRPWQLDCGECLAHEIRDWKSRKASCKAGCGELRSLRASVSLSDALRYFELTERLRQ
jgi:hypothetical protein